VEEAGDKKGKTRVASAQIPRHQSEIIERDYEGKNKKNHEHKADNFQQKRKLPNKGKNKEPGPFSG